LNAQGITQIHACLEATNTYGNEVARHLYQQGHIVSVVNPSRVKGFAQSELSRTKTDSADAGVIARFCARMQPRPWKPSPVAVSELQQMTRRREDLQHMLVQEKNRLETAIESLKARIKEHIQFIETEIQSLKQIIDNHIHQDEELKQALDLLVSIQGISVVSGSQILAEIGDWQIFQSARQLAAYAGITPQAKESGTSVQGKSRLCKIGNAHLRQALYFPALTAIRWCEPIRNWAQQLQARGKTKMQVVGAVMHKLIRIVYGVLKSGQPFDPQKLVCDG
jgi:transposase